MIYTNQPVLLDVRLTEGMTAIDLQNKSVRIDYWIPANTSTTPSGSWDATITDASTGRATYAIPAGVLEPAGAWRLQVVLVAANGEIPGKTIKMVVVGRGR